MVMSSSTPIRNAESSPTFQRGLGTPPRFRLKRPKESWEQIIRKAVTLRSKASMTFSTREIYGRVIETYPYFRMESPDIVHENISAALKRSDFFKPTGQSDEWAVSETLRDSIDFCSKPESLEPGPDKSLFKIFTSLPCTPIRESNTPLRPLIPNNRQVLFPDSFGPPKLAPLLPFTPTSSSNNDQQFPRQIKALRTHSGFSPIRSPSGMYDIFAKDVSDRHDSDTEDEDWKSIGPKGLFAKKYSSHSPQIQQPSTTPSKRNGLDSEAYHVPLPPTPITPNLTRGLKQANILPSISRKTNSQDDDEDTDDENWAQMDLTPKRKSVNLPLESHSPMKKASYDIYHVEEQLSNDKIIALEALALLCSPGRDPIPTNTERHGDIRPTPIHL